MGLESPQDLECGGEDSHSTIEAANEEVLGPRADTADLIVLEEGLAVLVHWVDLTDFEEIKRFPLLRVSSRCVIGLVIIPMLMPFQQISPLMISIMSDT